MAHAAVHKTALLAEAVVASVIGDRPPLTEAAVEEEEGGQMGR